MKKLHGFLLLNSDMLPRLSPSSTCVIQTNPVLFLISNSFLFISYFSYLLVLLFFHSKKKRSSIKKMFLERKGYKFLLSTFLHSPFPFLLLFPLLWPPPLFPPHPLSLPSLLFLFSIVLMIIAHRT